jgi:tetratricopeptide (TPR) repeat protein
LYTGLRKPSCSYFNNGRNFSHFFEIALKIAKLNSNAEYQEKVLSNIGACHQELCNYKKAIEYHEQALEIAKQFGD